jgi:hypothetical protein
VRLRSGPIRFEGVRGPNNQRPVISGLNAVTGTNTAFASWDVSQYLGLITVARADGDSQFFKPGHIRISGFELRDVQPTPNGVPQSHGEHIALMYDLLALAFKTDTTRVATFALAHDGDNRSHSEIGVVEGHHDLSHHQGNQERIDKIAKIDRWYAERFAKFLQQLEDARDIDGNSVLHNTRIVYGSGNADANRHSHDNLPVLLAGGGGGLLQTGRYVQHGGKPMSNLFLTLADQAGATDLQRFGDSTGRLANV